jgi:hypothetical protein
MERHSVAAEPAVAVARDSGSGSGTGSGSSSGSDTGSAAVAVAPLAEFGALKDGKARVIWAPKMN